MSKEDAGRTDLPRELLELAAGRFLDAEPEARARALEDLVRQHPRLEAALRGLAAELAGAERLLDEGYTEPPDPMLTIGPYRVLRVIGEGAFGIVHLCAQDAPVRREVAVKVLRPGAGDRHTLARFEAERHALAMLSHPAIAQVFDAGALPDGRPYFVMEHVCGLPISSHCDGNRLGVEARLELFVRLCRGVHHAHEGGIVHRDLKPANVLVFEQDGQPRPKIIDFGIAKALHGHAARALPASRAAPAPAIRTDTGRVVGTPGYMSPEQAAGRSSDLDARADVFSLGVILYELLTGEMPWGRRPETTDTEPPRPSARVAADTGGDAARLRALAPRRLASRLRGDLDWIVLKALERERDRRYASAKELADDVVRHLRGEAVLARPPALAYRLRRYARRHRLALSAGAAVVLASALGLWFSLSFRAEANTRTADVEAAAAGLLARANDAKIVAAPRSEVLRKALAEEALRFYEKFLRERPTEPRLREGRTRALWTLSQVHWLVGEYVASEAVAREATSEAEALVAADADQLGYRGILGNSLRNLGRALSCTGQRDAARAAFDRSVQELELCYSKAPAKYADLLVRALLEWGTTLNATEIGTCARTLRRAIAIQEETVRERPSLAATVDLLDALAAVGQVLTTLGELPEAGRMLRRADDLLEKTPDAGPAYECRVLASGATLAGRKGNHPAAIARLKKAIESARRWSEREPTWQRPWGELLDLHVALAQQCRASGDEPAAVAATRAAIEVGEARAARFPDDPVARGQLADHLSGFAMDLLNVGRRDVLAEAEQWMRRALALLDTLPTTVDQRMRARARWVHMSHFGLILDARGSDGARDHWEATADAMASWRALFGVDAEDAAPFVEAGLRVARRRLDAGSEVPAAETLGLVEGVLREHPQTGDRMHVHAQDAHRLRALLAARRGDDAGAAEHAELACAAGLGWRGLLAGADGLLAAWRAAQAGTPAARERAAGHRERAEEMLRPAFESLRGALAKEPADPWIAVASGNAGVRLAVVLLDRGEREAAQKVLGEALPILAAMRDVAHADWWDEHLYREAQALAAR